MADLWIETVALDEDTVALRIAGRLAGTGVGTLEHACTSALETGRPLALEVSGLTYVSLEGGRLLGAMKRKGLRIQGLTPLLSERLDDCLPKDFDGLAKDGLT